MTKQPPALHASSRNRAALEIALFYLTIGVLWILFSDIMAARFAPNEAALAQISIYKGWGYVLVSTLLLYWMIRSYTQRIRQTELTLSTSEKNYQELLQQASDGIFIADANGQYTFVNEEACRLVGYKKDELLAMNLRELIAPEDVQNTPPRLDDLRNGKTLLTERKLLRKDGSRIVCEISAKQLPDGRYQSIIRDITERKVTEHALRRSEERYRSLFENMIDGFARCQMIYENGIPHDFVYLDINDSFKTMTGLQNVIGKRVSEVIPGIREANPELFEIYGRVALTGNPEKFETYMPGLGIWFSISAYSIEKDFFATVFETISERKQTEAKLSHSEEQYRLMFANNPQPMWVFDRETFAFLAVNDATVAQYGYSREELLKMTIKDIRPPEDIPAMVHIVAAKSEPYLNVGIWKHRKKDGTLIDVEIARHDMLFDERKAFMILANDVTERKRAEGALHASEERLNGIIASAMDAVISVDTEHLIVLFNAAAEEMFGCPASEAVGRSMERFIPESFRAAHREHISTFGETGVTNRAMNTLGVILGLRTNGEEFPIEASISQIEINHKKLYTVILRDITERKRVENQQRYMANLVENVSDAIISTDAAFNIRSWNQAAEALYGWRMEEVLDKPLNDFIRNEFVDSTRAESIAEVFGKGTWKGEVIQHGQDGHAINILASVSLIRDSSQQPMGLVAINRDITGRIQAEKTRARLAAIVDSSEDAIIGKTLEGIITSWNVGAERLYGYSAAEVIGQSLALLFPSDRKDELSEILTKLKRGESIKHFETERQRKNGTRLFVSLTISPIKDALGQITAASTIARDITERKRAEAELRQSQENFAKAFNSNPAAIAITRLTDGKFTNINPAYTHIMGYEPADILNRTATEMNIYVHPGERAQVIQQLREQGTVQNYELLVRTQSGETRSIVVSMEPLLYNAEECILSVFIDISERKKMEMELQHSNTELEQFAYVASHDLQEPLRAMAGMVQLLQQRYQGQLDERADEYIGHAVEASTRMEKLINDLLEYSRVHRLDKALENAAVERSLNTALANLQIAIHESQAHITHDPLPTLRADPGQLTQMLQNLIGNAIKFRGERPLHIHIGAKKIEHAWQFEVSDNGIGIEPKYCERIFLVFQRLHTRREYPGTGIGLALCKKIIERHHGQIWVESQPGLGSTFYFTIPERQP